ncbi:SIS domain-containing protein [Nakamurella deserti]|uniref:SIS domain-containing protein n=1 Tax=Nakamurella deserti TaxID=2164074 RepID=UPI000DBE7610|nr:SIS domain-containing protein [Nakamurella deserti]
MTSLTRIHEELVATLDAVDPTRVQLAVAALTTPQTRWFTTGQGRSRLVACMAAMRLMHLGVDIHVIGDVTTPSIGPGDGLLVLSASGETPVTLHLARRAAEAGASILAVTTREDSSLGRLATLMVPLPVVSTRQFGGSLFEQAALLLLDSLVLDITGADPRTYRRMHERHTNLE